LIRPSAGAEGPKVVAIGVTGPFEVKIALDRAVDDDVVRAVVGEMIYFDENRPNLHALPGAKGGPAADHKGRLRVAAARLDDGGRTLVLTTDPHPRPALYQMSLLLGPGVLQHVEYDVTGVEVSWESEGADAGPVWTGWWPVLDLDEVQSRLAKADPHAVGLDRLEKPGRLTLTTLVRLPEGPVDIEISANTNHTASLDGEEGLKRDSREKVTTTLKLESKGEPALFTVSAATGPGKLRDLHVSYTFQDGARIEPRIAPRSLTLPWVPLPVPVPPPMENLPFLKGGDPKRGAIVFASEEAKCAHCHRVRGVGAEVGPDLSGLVGRDLKEVYRDIAEPSARIHPSFVPYTVALKDGRVLVGTVLAEGADSVRVTDSEAKATVLKRADVEEFRPSATSIMPVGLAGAVGEENVRDLVAFLTTDTPPVKPAGGGR
jgi:putative heme-binding domain-containing protein